MNRKTLAALELEMRAAVSRGEAPTLVGDYAAQALALARAYLDTHGECDADQPSATETGAKRYGGSTTPVAGAETTARGTPQAHNINGHVFIDGAGIDFPYTNCDKCGIQFGARYTRACEVVK
jgi:hypothetical protein